MEMPKKVALTTGLYSIIFVLINNNLFLLTKQNIELELIELIVIISFIIIAMAIGELIVKLYRG